LGGCKILICPNLSKYRPNLTKFAQIYVINLASKNLLGDATAYVA